MSNAKSSSVNKVHEDSQNEKKRTSSETPGTGRNEVPVAGLDVTCEVQQASLSNAKSSSVNKVYEESLN